MEIRPILRRLAFAGVVAMAAAGCQKEARPVPAQIVKIQEGLKLLRPDCGNEWDSEVFIRKVNETAGLEADRLRAAGIPVNLYRGTVELTEGERDFITWVNARQYEREVLLNAFFPELTCPSQIK